MRLLATTAAGSSPLARSRARRRCSRRVPDRWRASSASAPRPTRTCAGRRAASKALGARDPACAVARGRATGTDPAERARCIGAARARARLAERRRCAQIRRRGDRRRERAPPRRARPADRRWSVEALARPRRVVALDDHASTRRARTCCSRHASPREKDGTLANVAPGCSASSPPSAFDRRARARAALLADARPRARPPASRPLDLPGRVEGARPSRARARAASPTRGLRRLAQRRRRGWRARSIRWLILLKSVVVSRSRWRSAWIERRQSARMPARIAVPRRPQPRRPCSGCCSRWPTCIKLLSKEDVVPRRREPGDVPPGAARSPPLPAMLTYAVIPFGGALRVRRLHDLAGRRRPRLGRALHPRDRLARHLRHRARRAGRATTSSRCSAGCARRRR